MARTQFTLKPFVNIQPGSKAPEDPELLKKLQEVDKAIKEAKKKREEFNAIASELRDRNHPSEKSAAESVEEADKILAGLIALRYDVLDGK
ncbi:hypothetical protein J7T55_011483 [Diaporthe amygdali]|uniref:uncharacterized protein n=1 Tax=Phomopsis amygdali TaxID=1214568 RepID=UPI0022FF0F3D|nr:uncharacterized protein J7T55_011483 [Diaporthe amygdali]KAJ0123021.1 hypothetical protein J7T55_011483 [Diaporthe amygdali]